MADVSKRKAQKTKLN